MLRNLSARKWLLTKQRWGSSESPQKTLQSSRKPHGSIHVSIPWQIGSNNPISWSNVPYLCTLYWANTFTYVHSSFPWRYIYICCSRHCKLVSRNFISSLYKSSITAFVISMDSILSRICFMTHGELLKWVLWDCNTNSQVSTLQICSMIWGREWNNVCDTES